MIHKVKISRNCKAELSRKNEHVIKCLFTNFIQPIQHGFDPTNELPGKYKPSHKVDFMDSPMASAFRECAQKHNLFHYHIGYVHYRTGNDPHYPGDVSDGIAHTRIEISQSPEESTHIVVKVSESHSPFVVPIAQARDE